MTDPKPTHRVKANPVRYDGSPARHLREGDLVTVNSGPDCDGEHFVAVQEAPRRRGYVTDDSLEKIPTVEDLPIGTRVSVAYPAHTAHGGSVYFGEEVEGEVIGFLGDDVDVKGPTKSQYVGPRYLTKLEEPSEDVTVVDVPAETVTVASVVEALRLYGIRGDRSDLLVAAARGLDSQAA